MGSRGKGEEENGMERGGGGRKETMSIGRKEGGTNKKEE